MIISLPLLSFFFFFKTDSHICDPANSDIVHGKGIGGGGGSEIKGQKSTGEGVSNGYGIKGRQPNPIKTNINSISKSKENKISMNNKYVKDLDIGSIY